jgi:hypothetical protein
MHDSQTRAQRVARQSESSGSVARSGPPAPARAAALGAGGGEASSDGDAPEEVSASVPVVVSLDHSGPPPRPPTARKRAVPDVRGLPLRDAVHALHRAGFRVELTSGTGGLTFPASGALAAPGAVVRLQRGR